MKEYVFAHYCSHKECDNKHLTSSSETPKGVKCGSRDHVKNYRYNGKMVRYKKDQEFEGIEEGGAE